MATTLHTDLVIDILMKVASFPELLVH